MFGKLSGLFYVLKEEKMNKIITISREFGSGGREVGKRLAEKLGFAYYDSEIVKLLTKETGLSEKYIENISERGIYPYPFNFGKTFYMLNFVQSMQSDVLVKQTKIIKEIAKKGNCVIVGRGADVILKDYNTMNIFVYADMEFKIKRCLEKSKEDENFSLNELKQKIKQVDKNRKKFHNLLSDDSWGNKENYDLCINTSNIKIKDIIDPLSSYIDKWF